MLFRELTLMYDKELHVALKLARQAGALALRYYQRRSRVMTKLNETPVTAADRQLELVLAAGLARAFPGDRIIGEEHGRRHGAVGRFWTIDPIDGTNQFIHKTNGFCTMLALVVRGRPVVGVVAAPARRTLYYAAKSRGSFVVHGRRRRRLHLPDRFSQLTEATIGGPRRAEQASAVAQRVRKLVPVHRRVTVGSAGLELCAVADGQLDAALMTVVGLGIWDTAAAEIIVTEAGGRMTDFRGQPITYRWGSWSVSRGVIATGRRLLPDILDILRRRGVPAMLAAKYRRLRRSSQGR